MVYTVLQKLAAVNAQEVVYEIEQYSWLGIVGLIVKIILPLFLLLLIILSIRKFYVLVKKMQQSLERISETLERNETEHE